MCPQILLNYSSASLEFVLKVAEEGSRRYRLNGRAKKSEEFDSCFLIDDSEREVIFSDEFDKELAKLMLLSIEFVTIRSS
jgi:hypothetical protein